MVELAFRAYNDGQNLVAVAFPADGGDSVLRRAISLETLGLGCTGTPPVQHEMPFDTFRVSNRSALVKGGLELAVDYDRERVSITPYSPIGSPIDKRKVRYTFEDMEVCDQRESPIQQAKSQASIRITAERLPLDEENTWP